MKKFLALVLSLCMVFSLAAVASAAEIDADGGSGSTPVYLSSTTDGSILSGAPNPRPIAWFRLWFNITKPSHRVSGSSPGERSQ